MQRDGIRKSGKLIYLSVYDENQLSKDLIADIFDFKVIFKIPYPFLHILRKNVCMEFKRYMK